MDQVYIKLSREMRVELCRLARRDDVSPGQIIRDLIDKEIRRRLDARPPVRADERLVAPLRARLADDLAHSADWNELQHSLRAKGYELREAGGGLALHRHPSGRRVCKASELGFSYGRLMQRFHAPFPGHSHDWLVGRYLKEDADDIELIETAG